MGLKILHSADWHLDSPFAGFPENRRRLLKHAQKRIPETVARICRQENCDLVLLAGDLFDGPYRRETAAMLKNALADCGVPVFISPGNHDFCGPGSAWLEESWPENVHIFTGGLESVSLEDLDCRVYGAGYQSMDCPGLLEGFRAEGKERYHIAVLHGDPLQLRSAYCPVTASQVRDSALDYLALGHIHKEGSFRAGSTLCGWPGAPMGRGFDETGEKGIYLLEVGEETRIRQYLLNTPQFHELQVDTDRENLEDYLPGGGSDHFYRVILTGSGHGPSEETLGRFPNLELTDRREDPMDIWNSADEDTLEGCFFRILRNAMENADPETEKQLRLAAELSRKILEDREVVL